MWAFLYKMASPKSFYRISGLILPWLAALCVALFACGLIDGLFLAPADYQQGDAFRIIYIHVPSAFMSMMIYALLAFCALLSVVWKIKLADVVIKASLPLGAWFTVLALVTGSIWGKPMWGTWWIWDARLTSELILLFLYVGIIALQSALAQRKQAGQAVAILILVGFVDIPVIHYSVNWWNTLHQGATLSRFARPAMVGSMLYPLLMMIAAFFCYFVYLMLLRARTEVLNREQRSQWVKEIKCY